MSLLTKLKNNNFTYDNKPNVLNFTYDSTVRYYVLSDKGFVGSQDHKFNPISSTANNIVNLFIVTTTPGTITCDSDMWYKNDDNNFIKTKTISVTNDKTFQILTKSNKLNISSSSYNMRIRSFK